MNPPSNGNGADRPPRGGLAGISGGPGRPAGVTSPGGRGSRPGTLTGGRQLNAEPLGRQEVTEWQRERQSRRR